MIMPAPFPMRLDERLRFPDPALAPREGLIAIGGDLSVPRLLLAYRGGIFPWTTQPITWWSPDPRAVFEPAQFHVPQRLAKFIRQQPFGLTLNRAFRQVMEACAQPKPGREETWITPEFIRAYTCLHEQGHAHSVECWRGAELVGGIYGVAIGGFFAGESMFHRADNASKIALCHLVANLRTRGFTLLDLQTVTPATQPFGASEISRIDYLERLRVAVKLNCTFN